MLVRLSPDKQTGGEGMGNQSVSLTFLRCVMNTIDLLPIGCFTVLGLVVGLNFSGRGGEPDKKFPVLG